MIVVLSLTLQRDLGNWSSARGQTVIIICLGCVEREMGHPELDLSAKTAVVIGGTSGIGLAIAKGLAQAGANVIPTGRRAELVNAAAEQIKQLGRRTLSIPCDVTNHASVQSL